MIFEFDAMFDKDYVYFYETLHTAERTEEEVDLIWYLLNLKEGMTVLDLGCGYGRIANLLAQRECRLTGLDSANFFLELAHHHAAEQGIELEYIEGDMRSLPWSERFDCIVNWLTTYGYFNDDDNRKVLLEAHRALKKDGKLIIDHINRDFFLKNFRPSSVIERDGNYMIDRSRYDVLTGRMCTERIVIRDGQTRRMQYFVRLFTYPELRDHLIQAGFKQVDGYGSDGKILELDGKRMIVVAQK